MKFQATIKTTSNAATKTKKNDEQKDNIFYYNPSAGHTSACIIA